jgi:hypothetical protein
MAPRLQGGGAVLQGHASGLFQPGPASGSPAGLPRAMAQGLLAAAPGRHGRRRGEPARRARAGRQEAENGGPPTGVGTSGRPSRLCRLLTGPHRGWTPASRSCARNWAAGPNRPPLRWLRAWSADQASGLAAQLLAAVLSGEPCLWAGPETMPRAASSDRRSTREHHGSAINPAKRFG